MPASASAARRLRLGVGIDTARYGHHVTFLGDDLQRVAPDLPVPESRVGYQRLERQLQRLYEKHPDAELHVRIDAAGQYAANLEHFLRSLDLPLFVSVGEPKRNKDYHHAHSPKRQDDQTESWAMARYAVLERPAPSRPTPPEFAVLRRIASRLEAQVRQTTRLTNQLHELLSAVFPELANLARNITVQWVLKLLERYPTAPRIAAARLDSLQAIPRLSAEKAQQLQTAARNSVGTLRGETCEALVRQLVRELRASLDDESRWKKLLTQAFDALPPGPHRRIATITGIGKVTAAAIVATAVSIERFQTPEKFVGFYGVFPQAASSGVDKFGHPNPPGKKSMSARGNDLVRGLLWNCAKSAALFNPAVRTLYQRLTSHSRPDGKLPLRGDVAFGYCMTKLLRLAFAVWKTDRDFNPQHFPWEPSQNACHLDHPEPVRSDATGDQTSREETTTLGQTKAGDKGEAVAANAAAPAQEIAKAAGHNEPQSSRDNVVTAATASLSTRWTAGQRLPPSVSATSASSSPQPFHGPVDFAALRRQVTLRQVLQHLGVLHRFRNSSGWGSQLRGPCPLHKSRNERGRTFSVNLQRNIFRCFNPTCAAQGNILDLWAAYHDLPLHEAALHLAETFGVMPPRLKDHGSQLPKQRRGTRTHSVTESSTNNAGITPAHNA
jgi:transposase